MVLEFENDRVEVFFTPEEGIEATTFAINVYAEDKEGNSGKQLVHTSREFPLGRQRTMYHLDLNFTYYNRAAKAAAPGSAPLPNILEISFAAVIEGEESEIEETVEVHFVRYLPQLMGLKNFTNAEKLMRIWFTEGNNINKDTVDPKVDAITYEWAAQESNQVAVEGRQFIVQNTRELNAWIERSSKTALKSEINKMIAAGFTTLPTASKTSSSFGITDKSIVTHRGEKMPLFEQYYFNSKSFSGIGDMGLHYMFDGLDDFVASLANFNYHLLATGELKYEAGGIFSDPSVKVHVRQLGLYIKDSYDFIDDLPTEASQPLGYWKINSASEIEVKRKAAGEEDFFEVTNESFQAYRFAHGKGYNYHLYSTIQMIPVNVQFTL